MTDDDPDETEGRRKYRSIADKIARFQMNLGRVRMGDDKTVCNECGTLNLRASHCCHCGAKL